MNTLQMELAKVLSYLAEAQLKKGEESAIFLSSARNGLVYLTQNVSSFSSNGQQRLHTFRTLTVKALKQLDNGQFQRAVATVSLLRDLSIR